MASSIIFIMAKPNHKLKIICPNPENHSLVSVISQPRTCKQIDVAAACGNLEIEPSEETPFLLQAVVRYIFRDFFAMAHRTGLYNRQMGLWEAIARVCEVDAFRLEQGFFTKRFLPFFELHFNDGKGRLLFYAHVCEPDEAVVAAGDKEIERRQKELVKSVLSRAEKLKAAKGQLFGVFLVCPKPFPENILKSIEKSTGANDPVGKFESLLPEPLLVPIDLLEVDISAIENGSQDPAAVQLVHPDLGSRGATPSRPVARAVALTQPPDDDL
jgi:hypothetical protein